MRRLFAALSAALFAAMMTSMAGAAELRIGQGRTVIEDGRAYVEFDIAWRLSWRDETNWDAAWVVVKQARSFEDRHIPLAPDGHSLVANADPSQPGAVITPSEDGMGAFIYRDQAREGRGDNAWTLRLALQLDDDEAPGDLPDQLDVYGVEMVYVPEGPFDVGDPRPVEDAPNNAFFQVTEDGAGDAVYRVEDSGPIAYCDGPGTLCDAGTVEDGLDPGPIPAAYPNGYSAFYLMKYELTQGQYAAFLNTLSDGQTRSRDITVGRAYPSSRQTIALAGQTYVAGSPDRPAGYMGWADATAYADFAGLRPPSELEIIKAARGPDPAVAGEFAWGTTDIAQDDVIRGPDGERTNMEDGREYMNGNANFGGEAFEGGDGGNGVLRVDIFETRAFENDEPNKRVSAGLGFYGASGLSGSLFERYVTASGAAGRAFTGEHGDGDLSYPAEARVDGWPDMRAVGTGVSFGTSFGGAERNQLTLRTYGDYPAHYRGAAMGFRGARTAPD